MKRFISLLIITALIAPTLAGCNGGDDVSDYTDPIFTSEHRFHSFAITPDAEVYGLSSGQPVGKYTSDGELLETYPGTEGFSKLCYSNGFLYAYDQDARAVSELDVNTKNIRVINNDSDVLWWVRSMAVSGGSVYAAAVKNPDGDESYLSDGYMDYRGKERLIEIDIESGQLTEHTGVKKPFALYLSSNGTLYIYSHPESDYILYSFNTKSKKLKKESGMNDAGYTSAFVREGNFFVYSSSGVSLNAKNMKNKKVSACVNGAMPGGELVFHNGNIVFSDRSAKTLENAFRNVLLGKDSVKPLDSGGKAVDIKGEITVSGYINTLGLDTDALLQITGVSATIEPPYVSTMNADINNERFQEFLLSIMAGNPDIDIYVMSDPSALTNSVKKTGYYVPLNDSAPIQGYFDRCFDWVGESAKAPNGDIWALPVGYNIVAMFYVPENMERFGIAPEDLETFNGYWDTLNRINPVKGDAYITNGFPGIFELQYITLCQNAGNYDHGTPLFRDLFEKLYSGWRYCTYIYELEKYEGDLPTYHPVMECDQNAYRQSDELGRSREWDPDRMIFHMYDIDNAFSSMGRTNRYYQYYKEHDDMKDHREMHPDIDPTPIDLRRWRAMPVPRISEEVKPNYASALFAFVNPYSQNKELSVEYLEAIAENMLDVSYSNGDFTIAPFEKAPQFTLKDPSAYEGYYDMSIPIFTDIYEIFRDGKMGASLASGAPAEQDKNPITPAYITNYQEGKITLDEAVASRQREVDMWLYE